LARRTLATHKHCDDPEAAVERLIVHCTTGLVGAMLDLE
jgi:hypothetical protein